MKTAITIKGTHCQSCKALIEEVCRDISGVKSCKVDYNTGKAEIEHDGKLNFGLIKKEIEALGSYKVLV